MRSSRFGAWRDDLSEQALALALLTSPTMRRRVLITVVVASLVLIGAEATLRGFGERLGEPQFWYAPDAQQLVEDMDRLEAAGDHQRLGLRRLVDGAVRLSCSTGWVAIRRAINP